MTPFHAIDGGLDAFERAFAERALVGALKQRRFGAHLDRIGPPGDAAWDPIQGYVRLRGANFAAEQVGSFDGRSWLWSWANDHLRIPDDKTTVARKLRDEVGLPAFRSSMIAAADERLPYMMAGFALAHSDRCGYFIANRSQVYVMAPLPELAGPVTLAELAETSRALRAEPVMPYDAARALRFAAETFGLEHEANDEHVRVTIGGESLDVDVASGRMGRLAVAFLAGRGTLEQLVEQLRTVDGAPELTVEKGSAWATGPGWRARVSCVDTLRTVMAEANALPGRHEEARTKATVVVVETETDGSFEGGLVPSRSAFQSSWVPAAMVVDPVGAVPMPVLRLAEGLAAMPGSLVYDVALRTFYD
ncbi:MAG: hypothetical protein JJ863_35990 [Deltaproteobacteria bacterium]|nr:hypothetical protein [Deltaproteobacteria bacterium]